MKTTKRAIASGLLVAGLLLAPAGLSATTAAYAAPIGGGEPRQQAPGGRTAVADHKAVTDAGATGDGPATDGDCEAWGNAIDEAVGRTVIYGAGGPKYAGQAADAERDVAELEDQAEDAGCFIVYAD